MKIIEIESLPNGAHRNQSWSFPTIPQGYAKVPEDIDLPNFPFGEIETEEIDGVMTVTKWTPTAMPEIEEEEEEVEPTELEQLRADVDYIAIMTGVEL